VENHIQWPVAFGMTSILAIMICISIVTATAPMDDLIMGKKQHALWQYLPS